jgi:CYTH domain-containing protein
VIENEVKFVLSVDSKEEIEAACGPPGLILQGYLPGRARIRSKTKKKAKKSPEFTFTYKIPVNGMTVEIEKTISKHEFELLWPLTDWRLSKYRYSIKIDNIQWDIDYFLGDFGVNFAMAEAEMPEDMAEPGKIPKFLRPHIIYAVPRAETDAFSSRKLADEVYRDRVMRENYANWMARAVVGGSPSTI